jgi:hypothetical protein
MAYLPNNSNQYVNGTTIGATLPGSPAVTAFYLGANAITTALPTANTAGNLTRLLSDKFGRLISLPQVTRDMVSSNVSGSSVGFSDTAYHYMTTAIAGCYSDITYLAISNTSGTPTLVQTYDGTVTYTYSVPAQDMIAVSFNIPLKATTAGMAWRVISVTAVSQLVVSVQYLNNTA